MKFFLLTLCLSITGVTAKAQSLRSGFVYPDRELSTIDEKFSRGGSVKLALEYLRAERFDIYEFNGNVWSRERDGWSSTPTAVLVFQDDVARLCPRSDCVLYYARNYQRPLLSKLFGTHVFHVFITEKDGSIKEILQKNQHWRGDK